MSSSAAAPSSSSSPSSAPSAPSSSPPEAARFLVSGLVQGVFFRKHTVAAAERIGGLRGFVRNLRDGRVEAVAHGAPAQLAQLAAWLRSTGSPKSRVDGVERIALAPHDAAARAAAALPALVQAQTARDIDQAPKRRRQDDED